MKNWIIKEEWFNNQEITANENRFLCGNGYLGIRGALEEFQKEKLPAVNLSGIYDRVGDGWREPLNAPNPLYTRMKVDGEYYFYRKKSRSVIHRSWILNTDLSDATQRFTPKEVP